MGRYPLDVRVCAEYKMFLMKCFALFIPLVFAKNVTQVPKSISSICIETGNVQNGGTNGDVYVVLAGSSGECSTNTLDHPGTVDDFEEGSYMCYGYAEGLGDCANADIGTLKWARVDLVGNDNWFCVKIRVDFHDCYINHWLDNDNDNEVCHFSEVMKLTTVSKKNYCINYLLFDTRYID